VPGGKIDIRVDPDLQGFQGKLASGLRAATSSLSPIAKGIGLAVAGGLAVGSLALKDAISLGIEYGNNLNTLQSVSQATGAEMKQVGAVAKALGNDLTLPATSASDAAQAMLELAKGGLSVSEAMIAAKGTLQLAAAAQVSGAEAAEIQANSLQAFGLAADQAGRVSDVLANTANAASGEIIDVAYAMKQAATVANQYGLSIEDTATALGLLANAGIKGSDAGTLLKSALAALASPSKPAADAIRDLGLKVFDAQGRFVGLRSVMDQLHGASTRMTQQQYAAATSTAFGTDAMRLAGLAAQVTVKDWDAMHVAVSRSGGAAEVSAAKMKGLGGALQGFRSQAETVQLGVYEVIEPALESLVRKSTVLLGKAGNSLIDVLKTGESVAVQFGPRIAAAIDRKADAIGASVKKLAAPLAEGLGDAALQGIAIAGDYLHSLGEAVDTAVDKVSPLAKATGELVKSLSQSGGPIGAFGAGLGLIGDAAAGAAHLLGPPVAIVGALVRAFTDLPGPVQTAALALLALRAGPQVLSTLRSALSSTSRDADETAAKTGLLGRAFSAVTAPVRIAASGLSAATNTVRQFGGEVALQRGLIEQSGVSIGRLQGAVHAFEVSTIPAVAAARNFRDQTGAIRDAAAATGQPISAMGAAIGTLVERSTGMSQIRDSFHSASEGATRFSTAAGLAAGAGTGLKLAGQGLLGALGGPFGLAIAGAGIGLGFLASSQERAAASAEKHKQDIDKLAASLDKQTGAATSRTKADIADANAKNGVSDAANRQRIALDELLEAQTGNENAVTRVNHSLREQVSALLQNDAGLRDAARRLGEYGVSMGDLTEAAVGNEGALKRVEDRMAHLGKGEKIDFHGQLRIITDATRDFGLLGGTIGKANEDLAESQKRLRDARDALGSSSPFAERFTVALDGLGNSASSAASKAGYLKSILDDLRGGQIALANAQAALDRTFTSINDSLKSGIDRADGWGNALLKTDGALNTVTKNGQLLQRTADDISGQMANVAVATLDASRAMKDDLPTSFAKVRDSATQTRQRFMDVALAMGLNQQQAATLADQYGLIPEVVATQITTNGTAPKVQQEISGVLTKIHSIPGNTNTTVSALTAEAEERLKALGYNVDHLPNGKVVVTVSANTDPFFAALNRLRDSKTGTIMGLPVRFAEGGIAAAYASGGLRPMRGGVADIIGPNTWRVIGDRMQGDESYIPINQSARSVNILQETADRMGFALLKRYAQGGMASSGPISPAPVVPTGAVINNHVTVRDNEDAYVAATVMSRELAFQLRVS
jgi:TP901 family phage tail tape measure protein